MLSCAHTCDWAELKTVLLLLLLWCKLGVGTNALFANPSAIGIDSAGATLFVTENVRSASTQSFPLFGWLFDFMC